MMIHDVLISCLKDYENNPRNNDLAVEKVKYSIERFGFLFPIVIDTNYVIVAGHTRVRACRELGITTVPCIIADDLTEEQVNLFRLVDNKTSEYSSWDFEKLKSELARVDLTLEKNQIILERFELTAEVFDIEPEQAEIRIPTLNFMGASAEHQPVKKPPVGTIHNAGGELKSESEVDSLESESGDDLLKSESAVDSLESESGDSIPKFEDVVDSQGVERCEAVEPALSSVKDVVQRITDENSKEPIAPTEAQRESKPLPLYQFRFGDVAFFISKVEIDRLNAKYAEYVDATAALGCSFAEYILREVEAHD